MGPRSLKTNHFLRRVRKVPWDSLVQRREIKCSLPICEHPSSKPLTTANEVILQYEYVELVLGDLGNSSGSLGLAFATVRAQSFDVFSMGRLAAACLPNHLA